MGVPAFGWCGAVPQGWVDLGDDRLSGRRRPTVERPEMDAIAKLAAYVQEPGQAGVCRFSHATLRIKVEDRFGSASLLSQSAPTGIALAGGAVPTHAVANEIHVGVGLVSRPMPVEVIQEGGPIWRQAMNLKVPQGERKCVIYADEGWRPRADLGNQPFGDTAACPVLARAWGRTDLLRHSRASGRINPETGKAAGRRRRAGVVDADVPFELSHACVLAPPDRRQSRPVAESLLPNCPRRIGIVRSDMPGGERSPWSALPDAAFKG